LSNGRVDAELRFSQKILSLALVNKEENLIVAGDEAVLYTLTLRPFKCVAVTDIGHRPGSITAPLLPMGTLLLMCENDTLDTCLLRVFDTTDSKSLKQVAFTKIGGQVRDTAILRGKQLFVPSSGQRIFAYTVSDDPNQNTLTAVAPFDLEFKYDGPMFLTAGPDDQVWMASSSLRRFHLTTESLVMDPKQVAVGLSSQPIQDLGKNLYAGRLMPGTGASVLSQVDGSKMVSQWMTVTGSQILACDANGESTGVCFTSVGDCYFINQNDLLGGKFKYRPDLQLKIPATMESPLRAVRLGDGNYAIHCGLPKPQMWVVNPDGQLIRTFMLEAPLEADPVSIAAGVVLPLPGKLSLNRPSGRVVKDLIVAVEQGKKRKWKFLATLGKNQLVALDSENSLARIEFQTQQNVDSLREVDTAKLKTPVNQQMSVTDGKILIGDSAGNLSILDGANLDTLATAKLAGPVSNTVWSVGNRVFVESSEKELSCFALGATLIKKWTVQLGNDGLADKPIVKDGFVIAVKRNGGVVSIDVVTGELKKELQLGQPVNLGPREIAGMLVVGTIDGSLFRIESIIALSKQ
jgi:outer membrane protein assembly factor BamB